MTPLEAKFTNKYPMTDQEEIILLEQLVQRLSWAEQRRLARDLSVYGLTVPQYMVLRVLTQRGACSMGELAELTGQIAATMTGIIDRLSEHFLVERKPHPSDRRAYSVTLTQKGVDLMEEIRKQKHLRIEKMLGALSPTERHGMIDLLNRYLALITSEISD